MIDLTKLTPAPWFVVHFESVEAAQSDYAFEWADADTFRGPVGSVFQSVGGDAFTGLPGNIECSIDNAEFIALARNAFAGDPEALAWWEANRVRPGEKS